MYSLLESTKKGFLCVHMKVWSFLQEVKQQGSYRSGGIALINGVFEVCAKLIKRNDLKKIIK